MPKNNEAPLTPVRMRKEFPLKLKYPSTVEALRGFSFRTRSLLAILTLLLDCNCVLAQIKAQAVLQLATQVNTAMTMTNLLQRR